MDMIKYLFTADIEINKSSAADINCDHLASF